MSQNPSGSVWLSPAHVSVLGKLINTSNAQTGLLVLLLDEDSPEDGTERVDGGEEDVEEERKEGREETRWKNNSERGRENNVRREDDTPLSPWQQALHLFRCCRETQSAAPESLLMTREDK